MSRRERRRAGDRTPLVVVPEGAGDEPRMKLSQATIAHLERTPGGINPYRCRSCGAWTVTVHLHPGVTPMFLPCGVTTGCGGEAVSAMYPQRPLPADFADLTVWEWYRPSLDEFRTVPPHSRRHVEAGGLLIRARDGVVPAEAREETDSEKRARVGALFGGAR